MYLYEVTDDDFPIFIVDKISSSSRVIGITNIGINHTWVNTTLKMPRNIENQIEMLNAILSYSPTRLQGVIDESGPSVLGDPIYGDVDLIDEYIDFPDEDEIYDGDIIALQENSCTYPLHVAVVCVYHAIKNRDRVLDAMKIIDILISNGADVRIETGGIFVLNMKQSNSLNESHIRNFNGNYLVNQAIHLAMWLKRYPWVAYESETDECLNIVIKKLDVAASVLKSKLEEEKIQTKEVIADVASSYGKLLLSEDFSDVTFKCSDGVSLPAHKNILAISSDYFKTAFQGPWAENNADGVWETSHPSTLMKSVLTILYTGSVKKWRRY